MSHLDDLHATKITYYTPRSGRIEIDCDEGSIKMTPPGPISYPISYPRMSLWSHPAFPLVIALLAFTGWQLLTFFMSP